MKGVTVVRAAFVSLLFAGVALAAPDGPAANTPANTLPVTPTENTLSGGALPVLPEAEPPTVARDVGVAELPLLVTEPPAEETEVDIPAPVIGGADSTFNPFSPLLLPQPTGAAGQPPTRSPAQAPTQSPTVPPVQTQRPVPEAAPTTPPATPEVAIRVPVPAPAARTNSSTLPEAVTARLQPPALRRTPGARLLESTLTPPAALSPLDATTGRAAIRVPPSLTPLSAPATVASGPPGSGLAPLGLAGNDENVTSAASNAVSRALRELRVDFTAMATGTGIFRVGDISVPVLVRVGERLPGTELVLSRLTPGSAQFSTADVRHTLSLSP